MDPFKPPTGPFVPPGAFGPPAFGGPPMGWHPPGLPPELAFHPGMAFNPGTVMAERFEVVRTLGEGRCGFVYQVRDRQDGGTIKVVKAFDPRRGDAKDEELFRREVRLLKRIQHPRVPRAGGLFAHAGLLIAVQQHVAGEDLQVRVDRQGPLGEVAARDLLRAVLEVLIDLHGADPPILHRDLKPENLLLDAQDQVWVLDFGIATDSRRDRQHCDLGEVTANQTLGYAAPEQVMGLEAYPASDMFSLAVTVLYALTGKNPVLLYDAPTGQMLWSARVSAGFKELLDAMLRVPVRERLADAREALSRLDALG